MVAQVFLIKFCIFGERIIPYFLPKVKLLAPWRVLGVDTGICRKRQYLRTLRLVSKLPDLRVADANPHRAPKAHDEWVDGRTGNQKEKPKPNKSV